MSCIKYEAEDIDNVLDTLVKLRGMFCAVKYLMNPDGSNLGHPQEDFESWFADIQDRLDEAVNLLGGV